MKLTRSRQLEEEHVIERSFERLEREHGETNVVLVLLMLSLDSVSVSNRGWK
jgi:hypothetical protein